MSKKSNQDMKPINGLPQYLVTPDDYVYSKTSCRKVKRRWYNQKWHSPIRYNGKTYVVGHDDLISPLFDVTKLEEAPVDPRSYTEMREIPGFPAYAVSKEGVAWRMKPYKGNRRGRKTPFQLKERMHHGSTYYKLTNEDGKTSIKRAVRILEETWGETS
jgi:hypothetical protein